MSEHQSQISEWVGIDLGTTNTVAAVYIGGSGQGCVEVLYVVECGFWQYFTNI
jgi:molecular chaperone DnaK (HSP70)